MFCPKCGKENKSNQKWCCYCGTILSMQGETLPVEMKQQENKTAKPIEAKVTTIRQSTKKQKQPVRKTTVYNAGKQLTVKRIRKHNNALISVIIGAVVIALLCSVCLVLLSGHKLSFDLGYETSEKAPASQRVKRGDHAITPAEPQRDGYAFIGWYSKSRQSLPYDFACVVKKSETLSAKWAECDLTDTDGDGLVDSIERSLGSDLYKTDSDSDGLNDYLEFMVLFLDPLDTDTNHNKIPDGDEDSDSDSLQNLEELKLNTDPSLSDSDFDGLSDYEEINSFKTSPLDRDTDHDGVNDLTEINIGSDPLAAETLFVSRVGSMPVSEINTVALDVTAETDSAGAGTLTVEPIVLTNIPALTPASCGYLGYAYEIAADGQLNRATLTFYYDKSIGKISDDFIPCVYYYDENENELIEMGDQQLEEGKITVETEHFSKYVLMNKAEIEQRKLLLEIPDNADLSDKNNDGIPDYYAELINDGKLLYNYTYLLQGVLDMYGTDSTDWDGDGIRNGEEISVQSGLFGILYIKVISNPILQDSDFDGLTDFTEITQTHTSPMRYDHSSVAALNVLQNDNYYEYCAKDRSWLEDGFLSLIFNKKDKAKDCMIDFFFDYAPEETIIKNAEQIENKLNREKMLEIYCVVCNLANTAKDLSNILGSGLESAQLEKMYYESIDERADLVKKLNMDSMGIDIFSSSVSTMKLTSSLDSTIKEITSGSAVKLISGAEKGIELCAKAFQTYQAVCNYQVCSFAKEFGDYSKSAMALGYANPIPTTSTNFSVVCNLLEDVNSIGEISSTYSKLRANADAYNMYIDLLCYIRDNATSDYVREAAGEIATLVISESAEEYYAQLVAACARELTLKAFRQAFDKLAESNYYAFFVKLIYDISGLSTLSKTDINYEVMKEISYGCNALLNKAIHKNVHTFSYRSENTAYVEKYLVQLVQSRIIGEYYVFEYNAQQSILGSISNFFTGVKISDLHDYFVTELKDIYNRSNRLQLKLSKNLPYYDEFWSDSVAPDVIELDDGTILYPGYSNAYKNYVLNQNVVYEDDPSLVNGKTFTLDGLKYYKDQYTEPKFALYDVDSNNTPELIIFNGCPFMAEAQCHVFTCDNGQLKYAGPIGFRGCALYFYPEGQYRGLFCSDGNMGQFRTYYYSIKDGAAAQELVKEYTFDDTGKVVNTPATSNKGLYEQSTGGDGTALPFFTIGEIREMGWETFVQKALNPEASPKADGLAVFDSDEQYDMNIYLSNISEQRAFEKNGYNGYSWNHEDLVNFAFTWCKINRYSALGSAEDGGHYFFTLPLDTVNEVLKRFFNITLYDQDMRREHLPDPYSPSAYNFYRDGYFYYPAASGEMHYNYLSVVKQKEPAGQGQYTLYFDVYALLDSVYKANDYSVPKDFYRLSSEKAASDPGLTMVASGKAFIREYEENGLTQRYIVEYSMD